MEAAIKGDLSCVRGHFGNQGDQQETTMITGCRDCRGSTLHSYALVLERAKVEGSLFLCGGFTATGGVHLGDTTIGVNLNCTKGEFTVRPHGSNHPGKTTGRRLACEGDVRHHLACAFNGEGMHVKGSLIMNGIEVYGETRLTGALIDGDLDSADGKYHHKGANSIHGDRLRVQGNIFFCDGFKAYGTVRLPRADIGADLSFYNSHLANSLKDSPLLYCEGIRVRGTVYLKNFEAKDGYADISYSSIGGNLDCTDSKYLNRDGWALKANGTDVKGSVFLRSSAGGNFMAEGLVSLRGARLGMDLICTNGQFKSDKPSSVENDSFNALMADNMSIDGKVEMDGKKFAAIGGVCLDDTRIGSYLNCEHGTFKAPPLGENERFAISAGKLQVGGSIYLIKQFKAEGEVMLNDASTGRNLNLSKGTIINEGGFTLRAMQMKVAGSANMDNFVSQGEVRIDHAVIGGSLDCSKGEFINNREKNPGQESLGGDGKRYAFHANGVKIAGCAEFKDGFHADGIVSLQNANIGMHFTWMKIRDQSCAELFLDSARVGVLEDEEGSWPGKDKLQINGFEYQFLKELSPEGLKQRREKWLGLPRDFRTQPFEHLATVLKRSGYEEEAKEVLIEKNRAQRRLPVRWPWAKWLDRRCPPRGGHRQSQGTITWLIRVLFGALVCYGYKPSRAANIGLFFILIGWGLFYAGFSNKVMVSTKDKDKNYIYQTAQVVSLSDDQELKGITSDLGFYSLVYAVDTFLPVVDLQAADYWLPTDHSPNAEYSGWRVELLCLYRWWLIVSGWVISVFYVAALSGVVRR